MTNNKKSRIWRKLIAFLAIPMVIGAGVLTFRETAEEERVVKVRSMPFTHYLYATVEVRPQHVYEIGIFRDPGQIVKVHKELGDWVKRGEVVVELDTRAVELASESNQAQLKFSEEMGALPSEHDIDLQKLKEDYELLQVRAKEGYVAEYDLNQARLAVEEMENKITQERYAVESNLRTRTIRARSAAGRIRSASVRSSVDGTIIAVNKKLGEYLDIGETAFEVYENGVIEVIAKVAEEDYDAAFEGQSAVVELNAYPGKEFVGKVVKVYPTGDEINQQIDVEIRLEQLPDDIIPGLTGIARLVVEDMGPVLTIPSTAVFRDEVMVVRNGRVELRKVGIRHKGLIYAVIEGLKEGDVLLREFDTDFRLNRRIREIW